MVLLPAEYIYRKAAGVISPESIAAKVSEDIREEVKEVGKKPDSAEGYYPVGKHFIAKKMVYQGILLLVIGLAFFVMVLVPWIQARFFTRTFPINAEKMQGYTGKVRLIDNAEDKNLLFSGRMQDGRIQGEGTLYDYNGYKIYQGNFLMEMYDGYGETFYKNGNTCYKGEFAANQYEGQGKLYYQSGGMRYEGQFVQNLYEGQGTECFPNGRVCYRGEYVQGMYNGAGTLYYEDGTLKYQGTFADGLFSGTGEFRD